MVEWVSAWYVKQGLKYVGVTVLAVAITIGAMYVYDRFFSVAMGSASGSGGRQSMVDISNGDKGIVYEEVTKYTLGDLEIDITDDMHKDNVIDEPVIKHDRAEDAESGESFTPNMDWSSGELTDTQLRRMMFIAGRLYIKEEGLDDTARYNVVLDRPSLGELSKFKASIYYYVVEDVLTINSKIIIYDRKLEEQKVMLLPLRVKYNLDKIVLIKN